METDVIENEEQEVVEEETEEKPLEPWMIEEEAEEQTSGDPSKVVPVGKFVHLKKKLNGELSEKDKEIERLRQERDELKKVAPKQTVLKRPDRNEFDSDEEYELERSRYDEKMLQDTYDRNRLKEQQLEQEKTFQSDVDNSVSDHVDRVAAMVQEHGVSAEKVDIAHDNFTKAMSEAFPELGGEAAKRIIAMIGPGSEKVVFSHGVNKAKRDHLISLAKSDSSGLKLAVYLGEQKQKLNNPITPRTKAPDPAAEIKGDAQTTGAANRLKKKYDKAGAGTQDAYNAKKEAKAAGVDTSKW